MPQIDFTWKRIDDNTLALEDYPMVEIKLLPATEEARFVLFVEGHELGRSGELDIVKSKAERKAIELAEFRA